MGKLNENPNRKSFGTMPEIEKDISRAYEHSPGSREKKEELLSILNAEHFDETKFINLIKEWNDKVESLKGFETPSWEIDVIYAKHGRLSVIHFRGSDSIRFYPVLKGITN